MRLIRFVPAGFVLAALACRALLAHAPSSLAVDLAQPLPVATEWHRFGLLLWCALALPMLAAWFAYLSALRLRSRRVAIREVLALIVASGLCAWAVPLLFSSDVYAYAAYGELARFGIDPYTLGSWHAIEQPDRLMRAAAWQWSAAIPVCVYGPAFVELARVVTSLLHGFGALVQLNALRSIASLGLLACGVFAYRAYDGTRDARANAAATIALNPIAIWCAIEGHNDAPMLAVVLLGFWIARRVPAAGAAIVALAALIKVPAAAAALAFAAADRRLAVRLGTLTALTAVAFLSAPWLHGLRSGVGPHGVYAPQASFQALLLGFIAPLGLYAAPLTLVITAGAVLALAGYAIALLRSGDRTGYGVLAIAAWFAIPNPYPWYGLWLLPIAALLPRTRIASVMLGLTASALLRYLPDAVGPLGGGPSLLLAAGSVLPIAAWWLRDRPVSAIISAPL